jgi:hypothetical protein|nr:YbjN domain-containing protein [Candidatus Krumholzibacteria bacterium]
MDFSSQNHEEVYLRIKKMMMELFGEAGAITYEDSPGWMVPSGSAMVHVSVNSWRDGEMHLIQIVSFVAQGTELTPGCLRYLLDENHQMAFGGFSIDSDGDIAFSHSLIAETCSKEELKTVVMAMSGTADEQDDTIVQRWGGKRAQD